jgi:hypothetical protein
VVTLSVLAVVALALGLAPRWVGAEAARRLRAAAAARDATAEWTALRYRFPATLELAGLVVLGARGDTLVRAEAAGARLGWGWPRPRLASLHLAGAECRLPGAPDPAADAEEAPPEDPGAAGSPVAPRVQAAARQLAAALFIPARRLPELTLERVRITRGDQGAWLDALALRQRRAGIELAATGALALADTVPFDAQLAWGHDDALSGRAAFEIPDPAGGPAEPLVLTLGGRCTQDRRGGSLRLAEGTRLTLGALAFTLAGEFRRAGPALRAEVRAEGVTDAMLRESLPRAVLGPLTGLAYTGAFDWDARLDLDLAAPDSVRFDARVLPHALALVPGGDLEPGLLVQPFQARIHLRDGIVTRDLAPGAPGYRPLAAIAPVLRDAVLTNEDGGFWWHRGFNTQAIQLAIADNMRAGRFRRGAGTITMQLVRNLWLGQRKTLARKGQEVALAWTLEHLARVPKERLLEVYLNIIEWGPGVHGAQEAARFYFDRDAADLTLEQSLFLATLVPSPRRWRTRFGADGALRPWVRAQMHFIGRKMQGKGWLEPGALVAADSLTITLAGPAAQAFLPADTLAAAAAPAAPPRP